MAVRNKKGQFEKGSSGNENGRPRREKPSHRLPAENRNAILRIAEMEREVTIDGVKQKMTLFEAATLRLAIAAANGDRIATRQFTQMVLDTSKEDLTMRLSTKLLMERMNGISEENERLREKQAGKSGVIHDPNYSWDWIDLKDDDMARLDDGRTTMEG